MKRNGLGWWLAAINAAIVTPVAVGVSWFAVELLGRLADTRSSVILAAATLPLDSLGTSAQARAQALTRALLPIPTNPVD